MRRRIKKSRCAKKVATRRWDKYNHTDTDGEQFYVRVRVEKQKHTTKLARSRIFYTRFDKVTINPTKFPVDLQGTFQQNSTSFYTVTE